VPCERGDVCEREQNAEIDAEHHPWDRPAPAQADAIEQVQVERRDRADGVEQRANRRLQRGGQCQERDHEDHVVLVDADREHAESVDRQCRGERVRSEVAVVSKAPDAESGDADRSGSGKRPWIRQALLLECADRHDSPHGLEERVDAEGHALVPGARRVVRDPPHVGRVA